MKNFREITEKSGDTAVFTFGRFNPPTSGHEKVVNAVAAQQKKNSGSKMYVYASHSNDPKRNPLSHPKKLAYMRKMLPKYKRNIVASKARNIFEIATELHDKGHRAIVMVVGSDRVDEFDDLLNKYNGEDSRHGFYGFDNIEVVSAGERDPDGEGVGGMSATKMRDEAEKGNFDSFKTGIPDTMSDADKKKMYFDVRKGMGIREERDMGKMDTYEEMRDSYLTGKLWNVGSFVTVDGIVGEVVRKGTNYISYMTENGKVHKAWLHELKEGERWEDTPPTRDNPLVGVKDREGKALMHMNLSTVHSFFRLKEYSKNKEDLIKKIFRAGVDGDVAVTVEKKGRVPSNSGIPNSTGSLLTVHLSKSHEKQVKEAKSPLQRLRDFDKTRAAVGKKPIFKDKNVKFVKMKKKGLMTTMNVPTDELDKYLKKGYEIVESLDEAMGSMRPETGSKNIIITKLAIDMSKQGMSMPEVHKQLKLLRKKKLPELKKLAKELQMRQSKKEEVEVELDERNYRKEYDNYQGRPEQIARRSSRNKARRIMGDKTKIGMDVGHKDNNPLNNDSGNLRNEDPSKNRREPRLREEKVPNDELNWIKTGGMVGKKRRFPTYIVKKEGNKYKAYDEQNKMSFIAASNSLEGLAKLLKPYIEKRTGSWKFEEVELDELSSFLPWLDRAAAKVSQITHPKGWEIMLKKYVNGMKDKDHQKHPGAWASDIAREYSGINGRDLVKYINKLVDNGKLPKQLRADYDPLEEVLSKNASQQEYIDDFISSDAPQFKGKSKDKRIAMAIAAYNSKNDK
tara:strand:- start:604 stop:2979 length:2376 start_codon:yes stop_codon:yes gene_type:complete